MTSTFRSVNMVVKGGSASSVVVQISVYMDDLSHVARSAAGQAFVSMGDQRLIVFHAREVRYVSMVNDVTDAKSVTVKHAVCMV